MTPLSRDDLATVPDLPSISWGEGEGRGRGGNRKKIPMEISYRTRGGLASPLFVALIGLKAEFEFAGVNRLNGRFNCCVFALLILILNY